MGVELDHWLALARWTPLAVRARHGKLLEKVARTTAHTWAEDFLARLAQCT